MDLRRKKREKVEDYFVRLRRKKVGVAHEYQGVSQADVESVLGRVGCLTDDMRDCVRCLLNDDLPSLFPNSSGLKLSDGASVAHIGGYIGVFLRGKAKLDREGRDYWLRPLREIGAIEPITYDSAKHEFVSGHIKPKTPHSAYRLESSFRTLLQGVREKRFDRLCEDWISEDPKRERLKVLRESQQVATESAGASEHEKLIKQSINVYGKYFLPTFKVIFEDYSDGERIPEGRRRQLEEFGVRVGLAGVWPDVILYDSTSDSLWFIEAVTTDGEVDQQKWEGLKQLCIDSSKQFGGATTAYPDWKRVASRQKSNNNLHVGSRMWISDDPTKEFVVRGPEHGS